MTLLFRLVTPLIFLALPTLVTATELVMVERKGCHYCIEWKTDLGPIYPKTAMGKFAPLRMVDIDRDLPGKLTLARKVIFTPTFLLVENDQEIGRIEGYPSEDFFWGLLEMMLKAKTGYAGEG